MIEVSNLTKRFGPTVALNGVSFDVAAGEVLGLLGPNGAGKTTAMRVITCYLPADAGHVRVAEYDTLETPVRPDATVKLKGRSDTFAADIFADIMDEENAEFSGLVDVDRVFQAALSYIRYVHRLDHDPLHNLQSVADVKVTRRTDLNPGSEYSIDYSRTHMEGKLNLPTPHPIRLTASYTQQDRNGYRQSGAISHCAHCHVVSRDRRIELSDVDTIW